jgi:hypothetical protein
MSGTRARVVARQQKTAACFVIKTRRQGCLCGLGREHLLQAGTVFAADVDFAATEQSHDAASRRYGSYFADEIQVHDCRAADAHEMAGIELPLQVHHRAPQQMTLRTRMKLDVVLAGLAPLDFSRADEYDSSRRAD